MMTPLNHQTLQLGLIGDNIARSKSPRLHRTAGLLAGLDVSYERLIPVDMGLPFDAVFDHVRNEGFRGVNVTYPYKEAVTARVRIQDPLVRAIGAVNTVVFELEGPLGYNTDYTGFMAAYRQAFGTSRPGVVCLIGTGGVGKAVAFGLIALQAHTIRCVDLDARKSAELARALRALGTPAVIETHEDAALAAQGADGLINCTPLGMVGIGGTPLAPEAMRGAGWAFDAVYTPVETQFLCDAQAAGLSIISGYELFFGQGVDAWKIFSGLDADQLALRAAIQGDET